MRAWNSAAPAGATCDGVPVPTGFEGVHIFDISDLSDPVLVGSVEISNRVGADALGCGSHTITAVPDLDAGTLVIYNQSAGFLRDRRAGGVPRLRDPARRPGEPHYARRRSTCRGAWAATTPA